MDLNDRVAFVSGASGSLGAAIATALAQAGADVAVGYHTDRAGAEATAQAVTALGRRAALVPLDQTDPASVEAAVAAATEALGPLDVLINNAAWSTMVPFPDLAALTPEIWDRVTDTNVRGPFLLARAAAPHLRRAGEGRIVNIASVVGLAAMGSNMAHSVAKAGLIHLTRCLAVALAPQVAVNAVAPSLMEGTHGAQVAPPSAAEAMRQRAVLKRTPTVADVVAQVLYFCRTDSVTGQVLVIDGGLHFH